MLTESAKKLKSAFTHVCDDERCGVRIEAGKGGGLTLLIRSCLCVELTAKTKSLEEELDELKKSSTAGEKSEGVQEVAAVQATVSTAVRAVQTEDAAAVVDSTGVNTEDASQAACARCDASAARVMELEAIVAELKAHIHRAADDTETQTQAAAAKTSTLEAEVQRLRKELEVATESASAGDEQAATIAALRAELATVKATAQAADTALRAAEQSARDAEARAAAALDKGADMARAHADSQSAAMRDELEELKQTLAARDNALDVALRARADSDAAQATLTAKLAEATEWRTKFERQLPEAEQRATAASQRAADAAAAQATAQAQLDAVKGELERKASEMEAWEQRWKVSLSAATSRAEAAEADAASARDAAAAAKAEAVSARVSAATAAADVAAGAGAAASQLEALTAEFAAYKARAGAALRRKDEQLAAAQAAAEKASRDGGDEMVVSQAAAAAAQAESAMRALEASEKARAEEAAASATELTALGEALRHAEAAAAAACEAAAADVARARRDAQQAASGALTAAEDLRAKLMETQAQLQAALAENAAVRTEAESRVSAAQAELAQFRSMAMAMAEAKDADAAALRDEVAKLRNASTVLSSPGRSSSSAAATAWDALPVQRTASGGGPSSVSRVGSWASSTGGERGEGSTTFSTDDSDARRLLELASLQASRDGALEGALRRASVAEAKFQEVNAKLEVLQTELETLRAEAEELRRAHGRTHTDLTYLKQVVLKLLQTLEQDEQDALVLVVGTLLHFSPTEMRACQDAFDERHARLNKAVSGGATGYLVSAASSLLGGVWTTEPTTRGR